jgi:DNA-binding IclR family transcriptional regulator
MSAADSSRDPVKRSLALLSALADGGQGDYGVRELAALTDAAPSTVHRLLGALRDVGWVQAADGRYRVGAEFRRLARRVLSEVKLESVAIPHLRRLVEEADESAILGVFDPASFRYALVLSIDAGHPLKYVQELHQWVPAHVGATGLAICAALPVDERAAYLAETEFAVYTEHTPASAEAVEAVCRQARRRGYVLTRGHKVAGAVGIAAPLFSDQSGLDGVVGAVSLTVPEQRYRDRDRERVAELVRRCACDISAELGVASAPGWW